MLVCSVQSIAIFELSFLQFYGAYCSKNICYLVLRCHYRTYDLQLNYTEFHLHD